MAFEWHDHHFINGIACLDFANTVVYRDILARREDRLRTLADLNSWVDTAGLSAGLRLSLEDALALREAIDRLFRNIAASQSCPPLIWAEFIDHYRDLMGGCALQVTPQGLALSEPKSPALVEIAHSALMLALSPMIERVKICSGCGWLFVDRTRNATKRWCISSMCGSRDKARRYYARKTGQATPEDSPGAG